MGFPRVMSAVVGAALGAGAVVGLLAREPPTQPVPQGDLRPVVDRIREVARLETLSVGLHRKVTYEPAVPKADSTLRDLANWAAHEVRPHRGRAIVFADAHLSVDLRRVDARAAGRTVFVVLPDVVTRVELRPLETEVFDSNLEPAEQQVMMHQALVEMQSAVRQDAALRRRALESAQQSLRAFLVGAGFQDVRFVDALPASPAGA
ncbi:MAG: DUF4230 domain-containing protein [Deltaproteobacteria bacterium]|nr:DUF4230 domain-containing protein [Deltaproteobacteria bacterium]